MLAVQFNFYIIFAALGPEAAYNGNLPMLLVLRHTTSILPQFNITGFMAITILTPVTDDLGTLQDDESIDSDDDVHMSAGTSARPSRRSEGRNADSIIVVPGQLVTDDPQWMRYVISSLHTMPQSP